MPWLALGGAAMVLVAVAGFFLLKPSGDAKNETPQSTAATTSDASADAKSDPDYQTCDAGSGEGVIPACDRAIQSGRFSGADLVTLYRDRAIERADKNDVDGAIADYTEALGLDPKNIAAFNDRGELYRRKGEYDRAIEDYDQAIALDPKQPVPVNNRGLAFGSKGEHDRAIADFDQAIDLDPTAVKYLANRANAYRAKGEPERAKEDYAKALTLNPSADQKQNIETAMAGLATASPAAPDANMSEASSQPAASEKPAETPPTPDASKSEASSQPAAGEKPAETPSAPDASKSAAASAPATLEPAPPAADAAKVDPKSDPDYQACLKSGESTIEVCDKAIESRKFAGPALASLYVKRGVDQMAAKNLTAGVSDFSEAIKLDPNRAIAFSNRGGIYSLLGDREKALKDLDHAIELDPKYASAFNNRGLVYAGQRDYDRAIQDFNQAIALDPNYLKAYKNRGDAYRRKGDKALATSDYNKALTLNPSADVKKQIDAALYALGSAPSAAPSEAAVQAADQSPTPSSGNTPAVAPAPETAASTADPKADPDYQACARAKGDPAACDRAIASARFGGVDLATLYRYRGFGRLKGEKPDVEGALADYTEAVRLDPQNFIPYALRSEAYRAKGDFDAESKDLDRAIELNPIAAYYNSRGNALRKIGKLDRAIEDLNRAIELDPNYFGTYGNRGLAYQAKGDRDRAAEDYKKALTLKPDEEAKKTIEASLKGLESSRASTPAATPTQAAPGPAANEKTAADGGQAADEDFTACIKKEGDDAGAACNRVIASGKFSGGDLANLYISRGFMPASQMPDKKKSVDDALADFDAAVKLDPSKIGAFIGRGRTYIEMRDYDRGLKDIDEALKLNPQNAAALHWRGVAYAAQGNHDRAIESFDQAIRIDAKLLMAYFFRAYSYAKTGDRQHAIADYKMALSLDPDDKIRRSIERSLKKLGSDASDKKSEAPAPGGQNGRRAAKSGAVEPVSRATRFDHHAA